MRVFSLGSALVALCQLQAGELQNLGRQLFFDKRLSVDGSISCGSCHRPDTAFAEPFPTSLGVRNSKGKFNAPTILNLRRAKRFFWDGRAHTLEQQAEGPLLNAIEMGNTREELEARLSAIPEYRKRFKRVFGDDTVTLGRITKAVAAYERTLASSQSLYDAWRMGRREHWTSEHELGRQLFFGKAGCTKCHSGTNFTNYQLMPNDKGEVYRVPTLREALRTAPYMHDGSIPTLTQVLETHKGGAKMDDNARRGLLRFIESLTGDYSR